MCDKKLKITNLFLGFKKKKGFGKFWNKKKKIETKNKNQTNFAKQNSWEHILQHV